MILFVCEHSDAKYKQANRIWYYAIHPINLDIDTSKYIFMIMNIVKKLSLDDCGWYHSCILVQR